MMEEKEKKVKLHPYQTKAMKSTSRFVALIAGTGGGKTYFGPAWLCEEIRKAPEDQYFVVAPTYKMLTRATTPMLLDMYRGTDLEGEYNISKGLYYLPSGGKIWFGTADRPETLEAGQYKAAWLDEAGQMKYMVWVVMQARLGLKKGRALITTTPYSLNWLYTKFYKKWAENDSDYDVIQFSSIDSPYYPIDEFERAKHAMNPLLFDMRYKGQFRKMEGLVYPDFDQDCIIEPFDIPKGWRRQGAADFGTNNPHVTLKAALDRDDVLYVYFERYKAMTLLSDHAETMKDIEFVGDPSGKREIEELKNLKVKIRPGDNDVNMGIQRVNERIRTGRLKVFRTCENTVDEFASYHYPEGKDKPQKENDHCMDALRYLVMEVDRLRCQQAGDVYFVGMKERMKKEREREKEEEYEYGDAICGGDF